MKVTGIENIPNNGRLIIASNHITNYDPLILMCLIQRKIHYLAKQELFKYRIANWFLTSVHAIPINRHSGIVIRPVRKSLSVLSKEKVLGIFPEGTRCKDGKKRNPKKGVGFFAVKCEAPIIPIALIGMDKINGLRHPITVKIGPAIKSYELNNFNYSDIAQLVMEEISVMKTIDENSTEGQLPKNHFKSKHIT